MIRLKIFLSLSLLYGFAPSSSFAKDGHGYWNTRMRTCRQIMYKRGMYEKLSQLQVEKLCTCLMDKRISDEERSKCPSTALKGKPPQQTSKTETKVQEVPTFRPKEWRTFYSGIDSRGGRMEYQIDMNSIVTTNGATYYEYRDIFYNPILKQYQWMYSKDNFLRCDSLLVSRSADGPWTKLTVDTTKSPDEQPIPYLASRMFC